MNTSRLAKSVVGVASVIASLAFVGNVWAAGAPGATTASATSISSNRATLNGRVHPNGLATTWYFVYGTSTAYGSRTAAHSAGPGTGAVNVAASISGIGATTGYHFQLIASSARGTTDGGDRFLFTVGAPSAQATTVQSLTPTSGTLTGTLTPNGETTSWHFDYGTTTAYGSSTPTQNLAAGSAATTVSAAVSNLTPNSPLHFRLVASSRAGMSTSSDIALTTPASVQLAPAPAHVILGHYVLLHGTAWGGQAGVSVGIQAQPFGENAPATVATVLTGAGGNWSFPARPQILTTYSASAEGGTSGSVLVAVAPGITLRRISGHRYLAHVGAGTSFAGHVVQLQVFLQGRWKTVARERLNPNSSATFLSTLLPVGHSSLRIAFSVNQAGPGYLAGFSRRLAYARAAPPKR
jgi:hypothetical protein